MLAKQIEPLARKDGNPYYIWIEENQSFDHVIQYEQQIAKYQVQFKEGWTRIVERMVDHEIAFFREVCP